MISFKVQGKYISPISVWYHHSQSINSESCGYEIEISNEPELMATLEKSFGIEKENKRFLQEILKSNESHFNIISIIIRFLVKNENFPREDIKWVFNTIDEVFFEGYTLKIHGFASRYILG